MNSDMVKPEKFDHLHLVYHFTIPLQNLLVLLSNEDIACGSLADLPINAEALKTLKNSTIETTPNNSPGIHFSVNDSCVVVWDLVGKWQWFLDYIKKKGEGEKGRFETQVPGVRCHVPGLKCQVADV